MNVPADTYLEMLREAASTGDSVRFTEFRRELYQGFADNRDWQGMEDFFRAVVLSCASGDVQAELFGKSGELAGIEESLGKSLRAAVHPSTST